MPKKCERCRHELPRRALITVRCGNGTGPRDERAVCRECMEFDLPADIERFTHRALVVEPVARFSSYDFIALDKLASRGAGKSYAEDVQALLPPPEALCAQCQRPARFTWVPSAIYRGDPYSEVLHPDEVEPVVLCAGCVGARLREAFEQLAKLPRHVRMPVGGDGIWTSSGV